MMVRSRGCSVLPYLCPFEFIEGSSRNLDDWLVFIKMPREAEHQTLFRGH